MDKEIHDYIKLQSKIISSKHWSEDYEDLIQDGTVFVLALLKNGASPKESLLKTLKNFYSSKRRKIRTYEKRRSGLFEESQMQHTVENLEEEYIDDRDRNLIMELTRRYGLNKEEIMKLLGMNMQEFYDRIKRRKGM